MFNAFAVTLREIAELLLILQALQLCLRRNGRPDLFRFALQGAGAGAGVAAVVSLWTRGALGDVAMATLQVTFALLVIALTTGLLSSITLLRQRVEGLIAQRIHAPWAPAMVAGFAAIVAFREVAEVAIFLGAIGDAVGQTDALTGALCGVLATAGLVFLYRPLRARLTRAGLFGLSTVLMSALAAKLLVDGVGTLLHARWGADSAWMAMVLPFLEGGAWHTALCAALMLPPVALLARRWWHGASTGARAEA